jgi:hypothetical protein
MGSKVHYIPVVREMPLDGWTGSEMPSVCLRLWPAVVAAYRVAAFSSAIFFSAFSFPIRQSPARRPLCGLGQRFSTQISQPRPCSRSSSLDALRATLLHANWFLQGTANRSPRSHPKCHDGSLTSHACLLRSLSPVCLHIVCFNSPRNRKRRQHQSHRWSCHLICCASSDDWHGHSLAFGRLSS